VADSEIDSAGSADGANNATNSESDTTVDWLAVVGIDQDSIADTNTDSGGQPDDGRGSAPVRSSVDWLAVVGLDRQSRSHSESHASPAAGETVQDSVGSEVVDRNVDGLVEPKHPDGVEGSATERSSGVSDTLDDEDEFSLPFFKLALYGLGLIALYFLANFGDVWFASRSDVDSEATTAVVLGAAQYNGEPSGALRGRLDRALELYESEAVTLVVVTGGGQTDDITTEAKTGYDYLRDAGIPDEALKLEVQGTTTYESLSATARFLEAESITDVIIVTDPYHARRSTLIANEVGLEASAATTSNDGSIGRIANESIAVGVGRLISFRRFDAYLNS